MTDTTAATTPKPKTTKQLQEELKAAMADLKAPVSPEKSPAERDRDQRFAQVQANIEIFVTSIETLTEGTTELEPVIGIAKSLKTIEHRARKAIYGIPDSALNLDALGS